MKENHNNSLIELLVCHKKLSIEFRTQLAYIWNKEEISYFFPLRRKVTNFGLLSLDEFEFLKSSISFEKVSFLLEQKQLIYNLSLIEKNIFECRRHDSELKNSLFFKGLRDQYWDFSLNYLTGLILYLERKRIINACHSIELIILYIEFSIEKFKNFNFSYNLFPLFISFNDLIFSRKLPYYLYEEKMEIERNYFGLYDESLYQEIPEELKAIVIQFTKKCLAYLSILKLSGN